MKTVEETKKIYLAILNISSYCGMCGDATHLYGHLILSEQEKVNVDNVHEWGVITLGEEIEIRRPLTFEIASSLDEKEGGHSNQRRFRLTTENPDYIKENPELGTTYRFDTFEEVVSAGIAKWKELDIDCPFISLYEGDRYHSNEFEPSEMVVLQYGSETATKNSE